MYPTSSETVPGVMPPGLEMWVMTILPAWESPAEEIDPSSFFDAQVSPTVMPSS